MYRHSRGCACLLFWYKHVRLEKWQNCVTFCRSMFHFSQGRLDIPSHHPTDQLWCSNVFWQRPLFINESAAVGVWPLNNGEVATSFLTTYPFAFFGIQRSGFVFSVFPVRIWAWFFGYHKRGVPSFSSVSPEEFRTVPRNKPLASVLKSLLLSTYDHFPLPFGAVECFQLKECRYITEIH
jgi:hypothetical protein